MSDTQLDPVLLEHLHDCAVCETVAFCRAEVVATAQGALFRVVCRGCGYSAPPMKTGEDAADRWNSVQGVRAYHARQRDPTPDPLP